MSISRGEALDHVKKVLGEDFLDEDELDNLTEESMLGKDLALDDMDLSGVVLELEDRLNIKIRDEEVVDSCTNGSIDISIKSLLDVVSRKADDLVESTFELISCIEGVEQEARPLRRQLEGIGRRQAAFGSDFSLNLMEETFSDDMLITLIKRLREAGKNPEECSAYSIELMGYVKERKLDQIDNEDIAWFTHRMNHYNLLMVASNSKAKNRGEDR